LKAEKLMKKARKAKLIDGPKRKTSKTMIAKQLFDLAQTAQANGWSAEELLRSEINRRERALRTVEEPAREKSGRNQ
jgi:hypothetical protein